MPAEPTQQALAIRYSIYSVGILAAVLLVAFLYLFNFTTFFRLAPM